jgi:hypothetical protein
MVVEFNVTGIVSVGGRAPTGRAFRFKSSGREAHPCGLSASIPHASSALINSLVALAVVIIIGCQYVALAQFSYTIDQSIPVEVNGKNISLAWAGGINSAQINTMDINGDGLQDLVIFERTANKPLTYLNKNNSYQYAPEYETIFPSDVDQWMLLRDFNGDGKKDIFTSDPFGIKVYVNTTLPGQKISWRAYNNSVPLLTIGFSGNINLQVNGSDISAIDDIDGDGDLDILVARFSGIGSLEYHKNLSIETTGRTDSMQFKKITNNWGNFEECNCGKFIFGQAIKCPSFGGRLSHASGKSLLTIDLDNDGDRELLFSEEDCTTIYLLPNQGTKSDALIIASTTFPTDTPINFDVFPAAFYDDVTFDGVPDLVVSSNISTRTTFATAFNKTMWLYKNTGTGQQPVFTFMKNNFLQDQMIDVGDSSVPAFFDTDADGDLDMIVGSYGNEPNTSFYYYENSGTANAPAFKLVTQDYLNFSTLGNKLTNYKPQFADMDGDGKTDFVFTATSLADGLTTLYYYPNKNNAGLNVQGQELISTKRTIIQSENVLVADVNKDGIADLLIGTSTGAVEYWINYGPRGGFNYVLKNASYLGLSSSTARQNLALSAGDLNSDGNEDLIVGNQLGLLTIYDNYRNQPVQAVGVNQLIIDPLTSTLTNKKLGGRIWPVAANLFSKSQPSIIVGTITGGLILLKSNEALELPPEPVIDMYPNPVAATETLTIKTDRSMSLQFFTLLGQPLTDTMLLNANQPYTYSVANLATGLYIATFDKKIYKKFIVH